MVFLRVEKQCAFLNSVCMFASRCSLVLCSAVYVSIGVHDRFFSRSHHFTSSLILYVVYAISE